MLQSVRGMRDILPVEARRSRTVHDTIVETLLGHAFEEIELPLIEATELFARGMGESTDVVEKEMYSFDDRDGESLTLRPEGTAGCARALLQHGLLYNQQQRVFYRGPMFRYERPQKGRYRQFGQIGAETFGVADPAADAELIALGWACWQALGITDGVVLELNTIGSGEVRAAYRAALVAYFEPHAAQLDPDSRRRLGTNPLRILDSKHEPTRELVAGAPDVAGFLDAPSLAHHAEVERLLGALGIPFRRNPRLVRGLDYYTNTVFEWTTDRLGAQGTVCAGGRYDRLVEQLGGPSTPGCGFAIGVDRVVLLCDELRAATDPGAADVYCCLTDSSLAGSAFELAAALRRALPAIRIRVHLGGGKLKTQFRRADQSGARYALVVGEDELAAGRFGLKYLREDGRQEALAVDGLIAALAAASRPDAG
jgi:histidyl-tRNA synthetase